MKEETASTVLVLEKRGVRVLVPLPLAVKAVAAVVAARAVNSPGLNSFHLRFSRRLRWYGCWHLRCFSSGNEGLFPRNQGDFFADLGPLVQVGVGGFFVAGTFLLDFHGAHIPSQIAA